jgi:hypothetical protein
VIHDPSTSPRQISGQSAVDTLPPKLPPSSSLTVQPRVPFEFPAGKLRSTPRRAVCAAAIGGRSCRHRATSVWLNSAANAAGSVTAQPMARKMSVLVFRLK